MLYSVSSFSLSSTSTSGSESDNTSDNLTGPELARTAGGDPKNFTLPAEKHHHNHNQSHNQPQPKSISVNSSPVNYRQYDADNDLMMNTVRSLRGNALAGMLSWNNQNQPSPGFDIHYDPFNSSMNDTNHGEIRAPATADSTRSHKKVTWATQHHSVTSGENTEKDKPKHKKKKLSGMKSNLKRSHFPRIGRFHNSSHLQQSERPPSSLYSLTPDVTLDNQSIPTSNTVQGKNALRHPYDHNLSVDKHQRFMALSSSTIDLPGRNSAAPETLSSLFSANLEDVDGNDFAPTTVSAGYPQTQAKQQLGQEQKTSSNEMNTVTSLSDKFGGLSLDTTRLPSKSNDTNNATNTDVVMKDSSIRFSLRPNKYRSHTPIDDQHGVSIQESADGSFEDILDRKPPQLPDVSRVVEANHSSNEPNSISRPDAHPYDGYDEYDLPLSDLFPSTLDPGIRSPQQPVLESTQAQFIVNQRLSRLVSLLGQLCDLPLSEYKELSVEFSVGEKIAVLERIASRLSSKFEDKHMMRMLYESKTSQLSDLVQTLTDDNAELKAEIRKWREKCESESDEFDTALKRVVRIVETNSKGAENDNESRSNKVERLLSTVKGMVVQQDILNETLNDLRNKESELEVLRHSVVRLDILQGQLEEKTRELNQTRALLDRHKEMLESLEANHRKLARTLDQLVAANQHQLEELQSKGDKLAQAVNQLRDQTSIISDAEAHLQEQGATIQRLEIDAVQQKHTIEQLHLQVRSLEAHKEINEDLKQDLKELKTRVEELQLLQSDLTHIRTQALEAAALLKEVGELRQQKRSQEQEISSLVANLEEQQSLLEKANTEVESCTRQHKRLFLNKEEELKRIQLLLLDSNDMVNEYAQQLSFHRDRLSDTIQKYNHLGRSLDEINDQNRELRSSLLKSGSQRDELKRAFHALEVSCVRCLDGVIQEDSLEGIKQGLNTFGLLDEFSSRDLVILEDSASFLNEALALLSKEYRVLLKRAETEQMIPLRKPKRSSTKKSVAIDNDVLKDLKDNESVLSATKYVVLSRPMTRANSRVMRRQTEDDLGGRDTMRY